MANRWKDIRSNCSITLLNKVLKLAILTNGATWWFYLPIRAVSWERRKSHAVELDKQNGTEIAQKLVDLLSKENVSSGKAIQKKPRDIKFQRSLPTGVE